jgi:SAM-dependent methyltransferase
VTDDERRMILERYDRRLAELGPTPEALGWTKNRHVLRYHILLQPWQLKTERLLDFGCGFADMYAYCRESLPEVRYEGVDLNPSLIEVGRARYPGIALRAVDALRDGLEGEWDVIVASGVFNLKLADNWAFIQQIFELFARRARRGFAANFLSNRVDYQLADTFHADPVRVLELAYRFSNRVMLRNDYMPFEFTVYVDLRREFDREHVVYPDYLRFVRPRDASGDEGESNATA